MTARPKTRPRGFAPWNPRPDTLGLLAQVRGVLDEYQAHLPLTIRQVFYRLVGVHGYDKTEQAYSRLCETLGRARRAGFIPFDAIRDDGGTRHGGDAWSGPQEWLQGVARAARNFRLDRQEGQPTRLWLLCEASGMAPMLASAVADYGIPVLSSGGFDSLTAKHELAREIADAQGFSEGVEILHVGDHDPSGVHLFSALAEDVSAMVQSLGGPFPNFTRLAVTRAQAEALGLPTAPPKPTDNRAFQGETVQAEAIPPDVLSQIVRDAVEARQIASVRSDVLGREAEARLLLLDRLGVAA